MGLSSAHHCKHAAPEKPFWKIPQRGEESHHSLCNYLNHRRGAKRQLCQDSRKDCCLCVLVSPLQSTNDSACASLQAHVELFSSVGLFSCQGHLGGNVQGCGWEPESGALPWNFAVQQLCLAAWRLLFTTEHKCLEQIQRKMMETAVAHSPLGYVLPGT